MCHKKQFAFCLIILSLCLACSGTPESLKAKDYISWIGSPANGFRKEKKVRAVSIEARYLPPDYLAYRDYSNSGLAGSYDSILAYYRCGIVFQLTLTADKADREYGSLKNYGIHSREELSARIRHLSFGVEDFISLRVGDNAYAPVLGVFEGFDEMANRLTFTVAFQPTGHNCGDLDNMFTSVILTFDDPYWSLGTNHFSYSKNIFEGSPKLKM